MRALNFDDYKKELLSEKIHSPHFTIIGDVHGKYFRYKEICETTAYSLQLGDMSFNYVSLETLNSKRHRFFGGNHDGYYLTPVNNLKEDDPVVLNPSNHYVVTDRVYHMDNFPAHSLGQWGSWKIPEVENSKDFLGDIFFVRGAWSIDFAQRKEGLDWFPAEELTRKQALIALEDYKKAKPDFVVTHGAPDELLPFLELRYSNGEIIPTFTGSLLQAMFEIHRPKIWVFGHYHQNMSKLLHDTLFVCLDELSTLRFDKNLNFIRN